MYALIAKNSYIYLLSGELIPSREQNVITRIITCFLLQESTTLKSLSKVLDYVSSWLSIISRVSGSFINSSDGKVIQTPGILMAESEDWDELYALVKEQQRRAEEIASVIGYSLSNDTKPNLDTIKVGLCLQTYRYFLLDGICKDSFANSAIHWLSKSLMNQLHCLK